LNLPIDCFILFVLQSQTFAANDENASRFQSTKGGSYGPGEVSKLTTKSAVSRKSNRMALGDISNRAQKSDDDHMPKKKACGGTATT